MYVEMGFQLNLYRQERIFVPKNLRTSYVSIYVLIFYVQWMPLMDAINGCIYVPKTYVDINGRIYVPKTYVRHY